MATNTQNLFEKTSRYIELVNSENVSSEQIEKIISDVNAQSFLKGELKSLSNQLLLAIAVNPNTSPESLGNLFGHVPGAADVIMNDNRVSSMLPIENPDVYNNWAKKANYETVLSVPTSEFVQLLVYDTQKYDALVELAKSPYTNDIIKNKLLELSDDNMRSIMTAIQVSNSKDSSSMQLKQVYEELVSSKYNENYGGEFYTRPKEKVEEFIEIGIASNPNTPSHILKEIFQNNDIDNVSNIVFENESVDKAEALTWLAEPEGQYAFDRQLSEGLHQAIISSNQPLLIKPLIENQTLSNDLITNIIEQNNPDTLIALASKRGIAGSHLLQLSRTEHPEVQAIVEKKFASTPELFKETVEKYNNSKSENLSWAEDTLKDAVLNIWQKACVESQVENFGNLAIFTGKNYEIHRVSHGETPDHFGDIYEDPRAQLKVFERESGKLIAAIDESTSQVLYSLPSDQDKTRWGKISEGLGLSKANISSISIKPKESKELERD